ncbi:uncharacterized protein LOC131685427 [Topomyia yanbarensis]|uniref:uncharacterized protein LOC131685427 n=1 Tax=Topomyia yanbarensis TaxID=2498891 RepID=UPI00273AF5F1|nr:uncharacterized protein LOC131685427 [Topomyia yanbarensis]
MEIPMWSQVKAANGGGTVSSNPEESDDEPDFTNHSYDQQCYEPSDVGTDGPGDDQLDSVPLGRTYKPQDLYPMANSHGATTWPLESYHPVYVGNFKMLSLEEEAWYEQVSTYFAYKGLLTRMVYFHQLEKKLFSQFQRNHALLDMLVYFTSKRDADKAIKLCHRDSYYGHKLNVLPGRRPVYFDSQKSVLLFKKYNGRFCKSETFVEQDLSTFGQVKFIMKDSLDRTLVEFVSKQSMLAAVSTQSTFEPSVIEGNVMKQRFIEQDVKLGIEWTLQSNPSFMEMKPRRIILQYLYEGKRPLVDTSWMNNKSPMPCELAATNRRKWRQRNRILIGRYIAKKQAKDNKTKAEVFENPEKIGSNASSVDPPAEKPVVKQKSSKQKRAETLQLVNNFMRKHGMPPKSMTEINKQWEKAKLKKSGGKAKSE